MAAMKFRLPDEEEKRLLDTLGIRTDGVVVRIGSRDTLVLQHQRTRAIVYIDTTGCAEAQRLHKEEEP